MAPAGTCKPRFFYRLKVHPHGHTSPLTYLCNIRQIATFSLHNEVLSASYVAPKVECDTFQLLANSYSEYSQLSSALGR
jgi:hypothetical protein